VDECKEVFHASIEAGCEASEMLELVEAAFDTVAGLVEQRVMRDRHFARTGGGDDGDHVGVGDDLSEVVAVVGFVGNDAAAFDAVDELWRDDDIVDLASGKNEAQRPTESIGEHMDFRGQSSSGTPQRLIAVPPFPVAACW